MQDVGALAGVPEEWRDGRLDALRVGLPTEIRWPAVLFGEHIGTVEAFITHVRVMSTSS